MALGNMNLIVIPVGYIDTKDCAQIVLHSILASQTPLNRHQSSNCGMSRIIVNKSAGENVLVSYPKRGSSQLEIL
ncbi:hypothetical protein SERLADRAFT_403416 [Serpula lacrymans var. lacrymans S7.9]|nr:uncharacterized protein SERLADRAFT_403416 [Serpula lacrymans var. lacrymans S7.9]EGO19118.1 hypothetical protein SERLADRAFT_403416 [Serpula lacrymans var. lacrymans S7.9]